MVDMWNKGGASMFGGLETINKLRDQLSQVIYFEKDNKYLKGKGATDNLMDKANELVGENQIQEAILCLQAEV